MVHPQPGDYLRDNMPVRVAVGIRPHPLHDNGRYQKWNYDTRHEKPVLRVITGKWTGLSKLIVKREPLNSTVQFLAPETCPHETVHEIGTDFDKDGMLLRLIRCQKCGLLMRQYLPMR